MAPKAGNPVAADFLGGELITADCGVAWFSWMMRLPNTSATATCHGPGGGGIANPQADSDRQLDALADRGQAPGKLGGIDIAGAGDAAERHGIRKAMRRLVQIAQVRSGLADVEAVLGTAPRDGDAELPKMAGAEPLPKGQHYKVAKFMRRF
jgi:hypothetical protein